MRIVLQLELVLLQSMHSFETITKASLFHSIVHPAASLLSEAENGFVGASQVALLTATTDGHREVICYTL